MKALFSFGASMSWRGDSIVMAQSPDANGKRGFLSSWSTSIASVRLEEPSPIIIICLSGVDSSVFELSGKSQCIDCLSRRKIDR